VHPRTGIRRNSGRCEPADSATEMSTLVGVEQRIDPWRTGQTGCETLRSALATRALREGCAQIFDLTGAIRLTSDCRWIGMEIRNFLKKKDCGFGHR